MLQTLFPIGPDWSWGTFLLYITVALVVVVLCKRGVVVSHTRQIRMKGRNSSIGINTANLYFIFAIIILALLGSLRTMETGPDTAVYVGYFQNAHDINFSIDKLLSFNQQEPGFQLYLYLIRGVTDNYTVFFLITYTLIAAVYVVYIKRNWSEDSLFSMLEIFIYFYVANMSGMRSALGMVFLLPAHTYVSERKYLKAGILTLLACLFHYTMLFNFAMILLHWILTGTIFRRKRWVLPVSVVAVTFISYAGLDFLNSIISTTKYGYYTVSVDELSFLGSFPIVIFAILCFIFHTEIMKYSNDNTDSLQNTFILTICLLIAYPAIYLTAAYRIPNYYAMPRLRIWCELDKCLSRRISNNSKLIYKILVQIIVILYLLFRFTRSAGDASFAYHFIGF